MVIGKYVPASTENTQSHTQRVCPFRVRSNVNPSCRFHSFTVLSLDAVASRRPSGDIKHFKTYDPGSCACNFRNGSKCAVVLAPRRNFQT